MGTHLWSIGKNTRRFTALLLAIILVFSIAAIPQSNASAQEQREALAEWRPNASPTGATSHAATGGLAVNSGATITLSSGASITGVGTGTATNP